jgi:hypothetical protein
MEKGITYIISVHSFVDVITNSSTELFVCDTEKSVEMVRQMVDEMQDMYPNEYGHRLYTDVISSDDWRLQQIFDCYVDEEDCVKYLKAKGYKVEKLPQEEAAKCSYISISAERGGLHPKVKYFIESNFNVIHYDFDS